MRPCRTGLTDESFESLLAETLDVELVESNDRFLTCPHSSGWRTMPFSLFVEFPACEVVFERDGHSPMVASKGEALLLGAGVRHCISIAEQGEMPLRYAHVRVTILGCVDLFRLLDMPPMTSPELGPKVGALCGEITACAFDSATNALSRVLRLRSLTEQLLETVLSGVPWRQATLDGMQDIMRVVPVFRHIEDNLGEALTCAGLAEVADLSVTRFHEVFKRATGLTPMEFVIQLRIRRAQELLIRTADPVSSIGHAVGFQDPFHFSRQFRARCGASPSQYRNDVRESVGLLSAGGKDRN